MSQPTDPQTPWPRDTERLTNEQPTNPQMHWHSEEERLADEEKKHQDQQGRMAHARWRRESPEGRAESRYLHQRAQRAR
jgi:hypothetical protein